MLSRSWMTNRCNSSPGAIIRIAAKSTPRSGVPSRSSAGSAGCPAPKPRHVEHSERRGDGHEEIAGEDASRVVSDKHAPGLHIWSTTRPSTWRHLAANGPRRHPQPKLQQEFGRNPFLAPRAVRGRNIPDQLAQAAWPPRSSARFRLSAPEQPKALSMPPNERVRLHDHQDAPPLDQRRQRDERDPRGIVGTPRLHLTLNVERQLLSEKQVLCCERGRATEAMRR